MTVTNASIGRNVTWEEYGLTYSEMIAQEYAYNHCKFSAGWVDGDPVDELYLCCEKPGVERTLLRLRPDEAAAIAWCLTGLLYRLHLEDVIEPE